MKRRGCLIAVGLALAIAFGGGCLKKERTPYNEIPLIGEEAKPGTVNLWPFYNGDGRANYVAWPLVKWSPGCFTVLPFYNYDHGIQDIGLIGTASPETGEYRLWPLFYRSPEWWMLLPLAYCTDRDDFGSPLLFNHSRDFTHVLNVLRYRNASRHGWVVFPLAKVEWGNDAYCQLLTPLYCQTRMGGDMTWRVLFGVAGGESRANGSSWVFPLWWSWQNAGMRNRLLLPIWFQRNVPGKDAIGWMVPFFGRGCNPAADARWWFAFNVGASHGRLHERHWTGQYTSGRTPIYREETYRDVYRWGLPFWFSHEREGLSRADWTPLSVSWSVTSPNDSNLFLGPFGAPLLYYGTDTPQKDRAFSLPFSSIKTYAVTCARTGEPERAFLKSSEYSLLLGTVWNWERHFPLSADRALPVDLVGAATEDGSSRWTMALGLVGNHCAYNARNTWSRQWLFPVWFRGFRPDGDRWAHVVPFWWSWRKGGNIPEENRLLFPLWFSRSYPGADAHAWFTPFAGAGQDPARDAYWWFALTGGKSETTFEGLRGDNTKNSAGRYLTAAPRRRETTHWLLPFWFAHEREGERRSFWTPLSYAETGNGWSNLAIGPLGFPCYSRGRSLSCESDGGLLFSHSVSYHLTSVRAGVSERHSRASSASLMLAGLLWRQHTFQPPSGHVLPVDLVGDTKEGHDWSLAMGLAKASDIRWRTFGLYEKERETTRTFGWVLWRNKNVWDKTRDGAWQHSECLFTPLYRYSINTQCSGIHATRGLLLDAVRWSMHDRDASFSFSLLWTLVADYSSSPSHREFELLPWGLLWNNHASETSTTKSDRIDVRATSSRKRSLLLSIPYASETYRCTETTEEMDWKKGGLAATGRLYHSVRNTASAHLFLKTLYRYGLNDSRSWTWEKGMDRPETPKYDIYCEDSDVLFGLLYNADYQRDGSFARRSLFGLLYDHTRRTEDDTESFGILGYLYRFNRYADGTRERSVFPFVSIASNEEKRAWSFGFLHRFFRIEHTSEGMKWWFLWL